jgi:hypothetical protein
MFPVFVSYCFRICFVLFPYFSLFVGICVFFVFVTYLLYFIGLKCFLYCVRIVSVFIPYLFRICFVYLSYVFRICSRFVFVFVHMGSVVFSIFVLYMFFVCVFYMFPFFLQFELCCVSPCVEGRYALHNLTCITYSLCILAILYAAGIKHMVLLGTSSE